MSQYINPDKPVDGGNFMNYTYNPSAAQISPIYTVNGYTTDPFQNQDMSRRNIMANNPAYGNLPFGQAPMYGYTPQQQQTFGTFTPTNTQTDFNQYNPAANVGQNPWASVVQQAQVQPQNQMATYQPQTAYQQINPYGYGPVTPVMSSGEIISPWDKKETWSQVQVSQQPQFPTNINWNPSNNNYGGYISSTSNAGGIIPQYPAYAVPETDVSWAAICETNFKKKL